MTVLYRKYRPRVFSEVIGQDVIVKTLTLAIAQEKLSHAYLFTGSRGVGKTTVARVLARAVNCLNLKKGESCLACAVCTAFDAGTFLDMVEIDAASNTGVDNIRQLIEHVRFKPSLGNYKVFIIDEVHMLSKGAFNALLKTLEEPPAHALFILATTELSKLPATIVSRTQRFDFKRFSEPVLATQLARIAKTENLKISDEVLRLVAHQAGGSFRDALSILGKLGSLGDISISEAEVYLGATGIEHAHALFNLIVSGDTSPLPDFFEGVLSAGVDPLVFNKDFLEYLRSVLLVKISPNSSPDSLSEADRARVRSFSHALSEAELLFIIRLFLRSYKELGASPDDFPILLAALEAALRFQGKTGIKSGGPGSETIQKVVTNAPTVFSSQNSVAKGAPPPSIKQDAQNIAATPEESSVPDSVPVESATTYEDAHFTLEELQSAWPAICDNLKTVNGPLATLVKNSPIRDIEGGVVHLEVKFLFHKEHLESSKNQTLITSAIAAVLGKKLSVRAVLVKNPIIAALHPGSAIGDALKIFGGELVE